MRLGASRYPYCLRLKIKLGGSNFKNSLSRCKSCRIVAKSDFRDGVALDVAGNRRHLDVGMRLDLLNLIFEIDLAVTFDAHRFLVVLANFATLAHVQLFRNDLVFLGVDDWVGVDWNQNLVALAVDSYGIVKVLVLVVRSELNVDVLADSRRDHPFFVVLYLKIWGLRWQNVQPLWRWRVVDDFNFQNMRFPKFKTGKLNHGGRCAEKSIGANCIKLITHAQVVIFFSFSFSEHASL